MHLVESNHKAFAFLLAGLCLAVLAVVALELRYPPSFEQQEEVHSDTNSANLVPEQKAAEDIALLPLGNYEEIVERPLFRPSRRPPDPEETDEAEALRAAKEAQKPQVHVKDLFALSGIVVTDKKTVALLQDIKNNKSLRVREGEKLEGWQIVEIFPNSVLFSNNGHSEALELIRNFETEAQKRPGKGRPGRQPRQQRRR